MKNMPGFRSGAGLLAAFLILTFTLDTAEAQGRRRRGGGGANDLRREGKLKVGDDAPDFNLKKIDGKSKVKLSEFEDKQPVFLIFGSYT